MDGYMDRLCYAIQRCVLVFRFCFAFPLVDFVSSSEAVDLVIVLLCYILLVCRLAFGEVIRLWF
jgi:hypothetical protein